MLQETVLRPPSGLAFPDLRAFWRSRGLLAALVAGDIRSRYRQTVMGFAWNLIQPFVAMIVFSVIFGQFGSFQSDGLPYPLFFFSAFLVWQFFHKAVGLSVPSLAAHSQLISKVYFPRLIVLVFPIITAMVELGFSCVVLVGIFIYYQIAPTWTVICVPFFVMMAALTALAISSWLAPLNVLFRDIQVALPSLLQLGFFITPVVFSTSAISASWRWIIYLNPMAGVVEGCRWALAGGAPPPVIGLLLCLFVVALLLLSGLVFFQRAALTMVDRL